MAAFRALGDVIVKPLFGSMGLGMVRVSDEEMAYRVFRTIEQIRGVYYLQRTIDHGGRDVRAFVVGGRVLGAIERRSDGWRTNLARGGHGRGRRAVGGVERARGPGRGRRRRGVRRSGPAAGAGRHGLRAGGERHPRLARTAGGHRASTSPARWWSSSPSRPGDDAEEVAAAAQLACLLEVSAPKPGQRLAGACTSTTPATRTFWRAPSRSDRRSPRPASARWAPPSAPPSRPPRRWTRSQHQPGHRAAARAAGAGRGCSRREACASGCAAVLAQTTVADAAEAYAAIRRARPGGLGRLGRGRADTPDRSRCARRWPSRPSATRSRGSTSPISRSPSRSAPRPSGRARQDGLGLDRGDGRGYLTLLAADARHPHRAEAGAGRRPRRVSRRARGGRGRGRHATAAGRRRWRVSTPSSAIRGIPAIPARPPTSPAPRCSSLYLRVAGTAEENCRVEQFRVQVSKDYLVFASAHFITFRGHQCETLHGHNYRVGVAVEGDGGFGDACSCSTSAC